MESELGQDETKEFLANNYEGQYTPSEIADAIGKSSTSVQRHVNTLVKKKIIEKHEGGKYQYILTPEDFNRLKERISLITQYLQKQIGICQEAFTMGDKTRIRHSVDALLLLITPKMKDEKYKAKLKRIEDNWKKDYEKKLADYQKECEESNCPDVVDKPTPIPPIENYKLKFEAVLELYERSLRLY